MPPKKKPKKEEEVTKEAEEEKKIKKEEEEAEEEKETKTEEEETEKEKNVKKEEEEAEEEKNAKKEEEEVNDAEEEQTKDETEEEEESEEADDEDQGRGKRKRKSAIMSTFQPEDFTMAETPIVHIIKGRGEKLKDMPAVKASIEKYSNISEEMNVAHRFLYTTRGKVGKREIKGNILEFSGFLKDAPKGYDADKLEEEDEEAETKYSIKAFKMTIPQLKMLCDFFNIERTSDKGASLTKDDMIDNLLDFLGQPNEDFVNQPDKATKKGSTKTKKTASKKKKAAAKVEIVETDPFSLVRNHTKGKKPTDIALRQWVKAYVVCFDMDSATTKHAIKTASDKFGVDLAKRKEKMKQLLAEEM